LKISPKRCPKSILEEAQTSKECHVKQAVLDSKGRACPATKPGEANRKMARAARATWAEVTWPCHLCRSLNVGVFRAFREIVSFS